MKSLLESLLNRSSMCSSAFAKVTPFFAVQFLLVPPQPVLVALLAANLAPKLQLACLEVRLVDRCTIPLRLARELRRAVHRGNQRPSHRVASPSGLNIHLQAHVKLISRVWHEAFLGLARPRRILRRIMLSNINTFTLAIKSVELLRITKR